MDKGHRNAQNRTVAREIKIGVAANARTLPPRLVYAAHAREPREYRYPCIGALRTNIRTRT